MTPLRSLLCRLGLNRLARAKGEPPEARIGVDLPGIAPDDDAPAPVASEVSDLAPHAQSIFDRFANLRTKRNQHFYRALCAHLAGSHDDACLPMYFTFALSANDRGRRAAALIDSLVGLEGKRALDVGCAYGGFLVGLADHGADPTGFDIDASLLALGEHNFRDIGRRFPSHRADVTKAADIAHFRGRFDVITCNDVIEHVGDPRVAIEHISEMLRPGGLAYFEIPNRDEVSAVISDGHYQLFGITQLEHAQAAKYFDAHAPGTAYGVGHYLTLDAYRSLFEAAGLVMEDRTDPVNVRSMASVKALLAELQTTLPEKLATVPAVVRPEVEHAVTAYLAAAAAGRRTSPKKLYLSRFGTSFWRVTASRGSPTAV